jgi:hypothetical protein
MRANQRLYSGILEGLIGRGLRQAVCALLLLAPAVSVILAGRAAQNGPALPAAKTALAKSAVAGNPVAQNYGNLPLSFELNQGQTDARVKFVSRGSGYSLLLTSTEAALVLRKHSLEERRRSGVRAQGSGNESSARSDVVRMKFLGSNAAPQVQGLNELPGKSNYFIGNDPQKWRTNVPTYAKVKYRNIYAGIDAVFYGNGRRLENDFVIAPGANPEAITLGFENARQLEINRQGDLVLHTDGGDICLEKPRAYQQGSNSNEDVAAKYILEGDRRVGFEVGRYDPRKPLIIDPVLTYSTYLGGTGDDFGNAIAVDAGGNAYIGGDTTSANFPTVNPIPPSSGLSGDAFVTKVNPTGTALVYSTYLGGSAVDKVFGIAVNSNGEAFVTGLTRSNDFPTTAGAFQTVFGGGMCGVIPCRDAFVTRLNAAGSALMYSTYLGGTGDDNATAIAADAFGNAYVTGNTTGSFPTTNSALQPAQPGPLGQAFVSRIDTTKSGLNSLVYSTYLGGSDGVSEGNAIALDSGGNAYVTGDTIQTTFPITPNAFQPKLAPTASGGGGQDGFVTRLDTTKTGQASLIYSTYLGGDNTDTGFGIAVDSSKNVFIVGYTVSSNFPTTSSSFQPSRPLGGFEQAFVTKLNPANPASTALLYSSYLGGGKLQGQVVQRAFAVAVDSAANAYVTGRTDATDFPTFRPFQAASVGTMGNAFVTKIDPVGAKIVYSSYLGGSDFDRGFGIAVGAGSNPSAYLTGVTGSSNFAVTSGAFQTASGGGFDAIVAKVDDSAPDFGLAASDGSLTASATVTRGITATYNLQVLPVNGFSGTVSLTCTGAPPLTACSPPATVNPGTYQFTLDVTTTPHAFTLPDPPKFEPTSLRLRVSALWVLVLVLGLALLARRLPSAKLGRAGMLVVLFLTSTLTGCTIRAGGGGAGGGGGGGTIPGTYTLVLTGTDQSLSRSMNLTLVVNP